MLRAWPILTTALVFLSCACKSNNGAEAASGPGAAPAVAVGVISLQEQEVRDTSEYLATLFSRSSVALYPKVIGHISRILVKPGEWVKAGTVLVQIDPEQQQAMLDELVATKKHKEANLRFASERAKRAAHLFGEGLMSQQDAEQAESERAAAAADVSAADAQISAQASQLRFFKISAPFDGGVGDIPVKVGDLVTTATKVTTVDQSAKLELNVNVPVERAADITADSVLEMLDGHGAVAGTSRITFVADQADGAQLVLVKGVFPSSGAFKAAQMVRARIVWSTRRGLKLPTTAVVRQSGQPFVFVALKEGATVVAKLRAVTLGAVDGSDFVVIGGLAAGDQVVVSGVQKLRDGAPISPKS